MHKDTAFDAHGTAFDALNSRHPMHTVDGIRCTFCAVEDVEIPFEINSLRHTYRTL